MNDMLATVIAKSDQMNADDLIGGPRTITVTGVQIRPGEEQPVTCSFENDQGKPYKPGKSMRRVLISVWGADAKNYIGKSMTLYRDAEVAFGGLKVGGIRISHMSHMDKQQMVPLTEKRGSKKPFVVKPLVTQKQEAPEINITALSSQAQDAAEIGTANYVAFWQGLTNPQRVALKDVHERMKKIAADVDEHASAAEPTGADADAFVAGN